MLVNHTYHWPAKWRRPLLSLPEMKRNRRFFNVYYLVHIFSVYSSLASSHTQRPEYVTDPILIFRATYHTIDTAKQTPGRSVRLFSSSHHTAHTTPSPAFLRAQRSSFPKQRAWSRSGQCSTCYNTFCFGWMPSRGRTKVLVPPQLLMGS